jgi:hypothetical protein
MSSYPTLLVTCEVVKVGDTMGLYEAIDSLPSGSRLKFRGAAGVTIYIDVDVQSAGRLDVTIRKETHSGARKPDVTSAVYQGFNRQDCAAQERALRDLGIDPNTYTVV